MIDSVLVHPVVWNSLEEKEMDTREQHIGPVAPKEMPPIDLRHLRVLTDDTGVLQHARYCVPDRTHGYCTDDNARGLIALSLYQSPVPDPSVPRMVATCLSYLQHAFDKESGRFRNFMSYDRRWLEEEGSEDAHGRALWALGTAALCAPYESQRKLSALLFREALPEAARLISPRARSFALLGIDPYLTAVCVDASAHAILSRTATEITAAFHANRSDDWQWCEDILAYSNAKIPAALLTAGRRLKDGEVIETGLKALGWLFSLYLHENGHLSLIGNNGWWRRGGVRAAYDQQPVDAMSLVVASVEAYRATLDRVWLNRARMGLEWFLGRNDIGLPLYDPETGGCRDGLEPRGVNQNQGAESTLAWLISAAVFARVEREFGAGEADRLAWPAIN